MREPSGVQGVVRKRIDTIGIVKGGGRGRNGNANIRTGYNPVLTSRSRAACPAVLGSGCARHGSTKKPKSKVDLMGGKLS